jgi:HEAT repeat protein
MKSNTGRLTRSCAAAALLGFAGPAAAKYRIVADVLTGADAALARDASGRSFSVSVRQRGVVGPAMKVGKWGMLLGYQAMTPTLGDWRNVPLSPAAMRERVARMLKTQRGLYGFVGIANYDEARAIVQRRKAAEAKLVDELAALGPGGAKVLHQEYGELEKGREKLLFIKALARIDDPDAVGVLDRMLVGNDEFSMRREMIAALGNRAEAQVETVLAPYLSDSDKRMAMAAAQGLSGREGAVNVLLTAVQSDKRPADVRKEAIRSLGLVGSDKARDALSAVALGGDDVRVRESAIQELSRSYGSKAIDPLAALLGDPDVKIRHNTVKALSRIKTPEARELLQRAAEKDESEVVRTWAGKYLE